MPASLQYEFNEIKEAIAMEKEMATPTYLSLFATRGNLRRMRIIIALGFVSHHHLSKRQLIDPRLSL